MSAKRSNQKVIQQKYPMLYLIPLIAVLAVIPALLYRFTDNDRFLFVCESNLALRDLWCYVVSDVLYGF